MSQVSDHHQPQKHGFRTFLIVWVTQSISVIGSGMTYFALTVWVTTQLFGLPSQKPQLGLMLAAMGLCFTVPMLICAPIAGAFTDRRDRKRTMIVMDGCNAIVSAAAAALMWTNHLTVSVMLTLLVLSSISSTFHNSAFDASYSMIVPEAQLSRANGMMQMVWSLSSVIAPSIAALVIALPTWIHALSGLQSGAPIVMIIDAVTFLLAAVVLLFLVIPSPKRADVVKRSRRIGKRASASNPTGASPSIWADIRAGAAFITRRRPLLWLLATFTVANFTGTAFAVFPPLLLKFNLHDNLQLHGMNYESALATLNTACGIGGVLGGVIMTAWGGLKRRRIVAILVPLIIEGIGVAVLGLSPWFFLTVFVGFVAEMMIPIMNSHSQSIWQIQTPKEMQGRVFAVRRVIAQCTYPIGTVVAGWTAGLFNPGLVTGVFGLLLVVFCLLQWVNPHLLHVEDKDYMARLAQQQSGSAEVL